MNKNNTGFTLIELLVATVIATLIVIVASQIYKIGLNTTEKGAAKIEKSQKKRGIAKLIRTQLSCALAYKVKDGAIAFKGNAKHMILVSTFSVLEHYRSGLVLAYYRVCLTQDDKESLIVYEYRLIQDFNIRQLWKTKDPALFNIEPFDSVTLLKCEKISFQYLDTGSDKNSGLWLDQWDKNHLPKAIRIIGTVSGKPLCILATIAVTF